MVYIRPQLLHQLKTSEFVQWSAATSSVTITLFKDQTDKAAACFFLPVNFLIVRVTTNSIVALTLLSSSTQYCCTNSIVVQTELLHLKYCCTYSIVAQTSSRLVSRPTNIEKRFV